MPPADGFSPAPARSGWWWRVVGPLCGLAAVAGVRHAVRANEGAITVETATAAARGVAGFLSLAVPTDTGGEYDLNRLISAAALVQSADFWDAGLQVASGATPLLPDSLHGAAPSPDALDRLNAAGTFEVATRPDGGTSVFVPLLDRDQRIGRGWVEVWDAVPGAGSAGLREILSLLVLAGIIAAAFTASPRAPASRRRITAAFPVVMMLLLVAQSGIALHAMAGSATERSLGRARRLAEVAAVSRRRSLAELERVAPGMTVEAGDSVDLSREVQREPVNGAVEVSVAGVLSGDRPIRLSMAPYRSRLATLWLALVGWTLLLAAGTAFTAWAAGAVGAATRFREVLTAWGFLAPAASHLLLFSFGPVLFTLWISLHRWNLDEAAHPWAGVANFVALFGDPSFLHSLAVTALYSAYVPITLALALGAALLLHGSGWPLRFLTILLSVPFISSVVAVALVWQWIYQAGPGMLGNPRTAMAALMLVAIWIHLGYQTVILLAGLRGIPRACYEAAEVDGAGVWQRFCRVTLPLLRPTIFFVVITGTIASFQVFTLVSVLTGGGPQGATDAVVYHIYQEGWGALRFGTASAMSLVLAVALGVTAWVEIRWLGRDIELA